MVDMKTTIVFVFLTIGLTIQQLFYSARSDPDALSIFNTKTKRLLKPFSINYSSIHSFIPLIDA